MTQQIAINDIETGIELPDIGTKPRLYPTLYTMECGQSFKKPLEEYIRLHSASQACRKSTGRRFAMRKVEEKGEKFVRIWRTE